MCIPLCFHKIQVYIFLSEEMKCNASVRNVNKVSTWKLPGVTLHELGN